MPWTNRILLAPLIGLAAGLPLGKGLLAQEAEPSALAWVEIRTSPQQSELIEIIGHAQGLSEVSGRFSLQVRRTGRGGSSNGSQAGQFHVRPGEAVTLSRSAINVPPGSGLDVLLTLYAGEKEIFSTQLKSKS